MAVSKRTTMAKRTSVVLVGIDFSEASQEALQTAENLARAAPSAELHLVHALAMPAIPPDPQELFAQAENAVENEAVRAREKLNSMVAAATSGIDRVIGHLRIGRPAAAIVSLASDIDADLVIVGRGHRTHRFGFGSVAERVTRSAPCPVLVVRPKEIPMWKQIEPVCQDCADVQHATNARHLWCARHSQHHPRWHTYHESPGSYGLGAMTFRE